ncbi:Uncharacterised protein [Vibrio cholerae]|nr:Uncharacterised protein [Vibrio cholerae]
MHRFDRHRNIAMSSDKNDRQFTVLMQYGAQ